ncbi:beta-lactamase family protein [Thermobifida halotolerans]|uniref:Beta-lactamase n=1 Tax=Thermobifida halotolerans TaxID=483545 RepID=A0A399G8P9_9ACTN|nr:serine hydrolase domain-containing protein [Thermobifida halotolerans]UOE20604.1 beta-lactamase family protein [Thermobifida halotolerans]
MTVETHGDDRLAARLEELLGPRHPVVAAAVVSPRGTAVAGRGTGPDSDFEIGSISKGVTGLLYADALARGEIGPDTTLGDLLPLDGTPAAEVTLASLSTHRSGLPSLPASAHPWRRTLALWRHGTNPYGENLAQLLDQARKVRLGKPRPRYSNFGFELLGHALARAAATTYAELLHRRIAAPLELDRCYVPATADQLRPGALTGTGRRGRPKEPWTGEALGPAGGIRASITGMARLTAALLEGTAPGIAALDPVTSFGAGARIGAAWITTPVRGRPVTWHNGGTGGFRSWLGIDRAASTGVVVLSATARSVDRHGFALLTEYGATGR